MIVTAVAQERLPAGLPIRHPGLDVHEADFTVLVVPHFWHELPLRLVERLTVVATQWPGFARDTIAGID